VPSVSPFGGLGRPAIVAALGTTAVAVWSPPSALIAAGALGALYLAALAALERDGVRELISLRGVIRRQ
jgi:hypothetical protein